MRFLPLFTFFALSELLGGGILVGQSGARTATVAPHSPVVFPESPRKVMSSIGFGHKVKILGLAWPKHRPNGGQTWIGDRPRGQTRPEVGIIWAGPAEIPAAEATFELGQPVSHRGISLKGHSPFESVKEDTGNKRTLRL